MTQYKTKTDFATVQNEINDYCDTLRVPYLEVYDETDMHVVIVYSKDGNILDGLTDKIQRHPIICTKKQVRGGTALVLSHESISEERINKAIAGFIGDNMSLSDKLSLVFDSLYKQPIVDDTIDFTATAKRLAESAVKTKRSKDVPLKFGFESVVLEALEGMATPTGEQPSELMEKFAKALAVLGQKMGGPPLQDLLKEKGINWKTSDDGQAIILFVTNASTNLPQPIAQIRTETLTKSNEFEVQLFNMIDFATGAAPGAFKQESDALKAKEQAVREIAKSVNPQPTDNDSVSAMMSQVTPVPPPQAQAAAAPATPAGQQPLPAPPRPQPGKV